MQPASMEGTPFIQQMFMFIPGYILVESVINLLDCGVFPKVLT